MIRKPHRLFLIFFAYTFLGGSMHIYKTIKNFLLDQNYFIDLWQDNIHIYGFTKIEVLQETKAIFNIEDFKLEIIGTNFRVLKLTNKEILLQGSILEMRKI